MPRSLSVEDMSSDLMNQQVQLTLKFGGYCIAVAVSCSVIVGITLPDHPWWSYIPIVSGGLCIYWIAIRLVIHLVAPELIGYSRHISRIIEKSYRSELSQMSSAALLTRRERLIGDQKGRFVLAAVLIIGPCATMTLVLPDVIWVRTIVFAAWVGPAAFGVRKYIRPVNLRLEAIESEMISRGTAAARKRGD